jgi:hypothetical protein
MARKASNGAKYVYGVVRAEGAPAPRYRGIDRKQVRIVANDRLGALTSDVPDGDLEAGRDELLAHSRVLGKALERGTVLPMRFGVVMPNEDAVRKDLLDPHRDELEAQLDEMEGKVEVNVKAMYDEPAVLMEVIREVPEVGKIRQAIQGKPEDATYYERIRLGELISEALTSKRADDGDQIVDRLAPHTIAVEVGEPVHERMAVNASFLVDRGQLDAFNRELDALAAEQAERMRFKYNGPLAPHSFVELAMEA